MESEPISSYCRMWDATWIADAIRVKLMHGGFSYVVVALFQHQKIGLSSCLSKDHLNLKKAVKNRA